MKKVIITFLLLVAHGVVVHAQKYSCPLNEGKMFFKEKLAIDELPPFFIQITSAKDSIIKSSVEGKVLKILDKRGEGVVMGGFGIILKKDSTYISYVDVKSTKLKKGNDVSIGDEIGIAKKEKLEGKEIYYVELGINFYRKKDKIVEEKRVRDNFKCEVVGSESELVK